MGKSNREASQTIKKGQAPTTIKKQASRKTESKDLFNDITTNEEASIAKKSEPQPDRRMLVENPEMALVPEGDEYSEIEYDVNDLSKANNNKGVVSEVLNNLLVKNKINSKNAFEVPVLAVHQLPEFRSSSFNDMGWKKLSSALQAGHRVYGYRVDAVHNDTFRMMGGLDRGENVKKAEQGVPQNRFDQLHNQVLNFGSNDLDDRLGAGQLEKNADAINMDGFDYMFDVNPFYERTRRLFDQSGSHGLLLNSLKLGGRLELLIESEDKTDVAAQSRSNDVELGRLITDNDKSMEVWQSVSGFKDNLNNYIERLFGHRLTSSFENQVYDFEAQQQANEHKQNLESEKQNTVGNQEDDLENVIEVEEILPTRTKEDELNRIQAKAKYVGTGSGVIYDFAADAKNWMSDVDMKFTKMNLGFSLRVQKVPIVNVIPKQPQEIVQFDEQQVLEREEVLKPERLKERKQYDQSQEDYNLLPMTPFPHLTSENLTGYFLKNSHHNHDSYQQNGTVQIKVQVEDYQDNVQQARIHESKKTQSSIKEIKGYLRHILTEFKTVGTKGSLADCYSQMTRDTQAQPDISIQTCFVTLLHLANEQGLVLTNSEDCSDLFVDNLASAFV